MLPRYTPSRTGVRCPVLSPESPSCPSSPPHQACFGGSKTCLWLGMSKCARCESEPPACWAADTPLQPHSLQAVDCTLACTVASSLTDAQGVLPKTAAAGTISGGSTFPEVHPAFKPCGIVLLLLKWASSHLRWHCRLLIPAAHTPHVIWQAVAGAAHGFSMHRPTSAPCSNSCSASTSCHATPQRSVSAPSRSAAHAVLMLLQLAGRVSQLSSSPSC